MPSRETIGTIIDKIAEQYEAAAGVEDEDSGQTIPLDVAKRHANALRKLREPLIDYVLKAEELDVDALSFLAVSGAFFLSSMRLGGVELPKFMDMPFSDRKKDRDTWK